jgi:hypothetical protein
MMQPYPDQLRRSTPQLREVKKSRGWLILIDIDQNWEGIKNQADWAIG